MDSVENYRQIIKRLLNEYAVFFDFGDRVQSQTIFDLEQERYMLISIGWMGVRRVHDCIMHVDIIEAQVWIQENNTDRSIAEELVAAGIPPKSIVLGVQQPELRAYTDYGVPNLTRSQVSLKVR